MNDQNQNKETWETTPAAGETPTGEPTEQREIPTPPPAQAKVRTLESDLKSLQESGGQEPQPYVVEINQREAEPAPQETVPPASLPPRPKISPALTPESPKPKSKVMKIILIILAILILGAAIGLVGYYLVMPLILSQNQEGSPAAGGPTSGSPSETVPREEIILTPLTLENLQNTLAAAAGNMPLNSQKNLVLRDEDQSLINLSDLLPLVFPELTKEEILNFFSENFTLALWFDDQGARPVYILQPKPTMAFIAIQTFIKQKSQSATFEYDWLNDRLILASPNSNFSAILKNLK